VHFLQLPRLLSQFRSVDHEKNISSCIARVAALRGTFENRTVPGGPKDPRTLILIWDTGASFGLTPFRSALTMWSVIFQSGMSLKLIGSSALVLQYTNSRIPMVILCIFFVFRITFHRQTFVSFPLKPTIKCMGVIRRFMVKAFK